MEMNVEKVKNAYELLKISVSLMSDTPEKALVQTALETLESIILEQNNGN